jgi:hypothetical protein
VQDHSKNSSNLALIVISTEIDSIVLKTLVEVQSLLSPLQLSSFELILVYNQGTPPDSELSDNFKFIKVPKKNAAYSRNQGVLHTKAQNIAFIDNDTHIKKDWLQRIVRFCDEPHLDAIFFKKEGENGEEIDGIFNPEQRNIPPIYFADTAACMVKRTVFKKGLIFNEEFERCEDADFATSLIRYKFLVEFSMITFCDREIETKEEKELKIQITAPYVSMLVDKYSKVKVEGVHLQAISPIRSYLNLLSKNGINKRLIEDFFIYDSRFYYFDKDRFKSSINFDVGFQSKNTKVIKITSSKL